MSVKLRNMCLLSLTLHFIPNDGQTRKSRGDKSLQTCEAVFNEKRNPKQNKYWQDRGLSEVRECEEMRSEGKEEEEKERERRWVKRSERGRTIEDRGRDERGGREGKTSSTLRAGSVLFSKVTVGISTRNVSSNWIEEGKQINKYINKSVNKPSKSTECQKTGGGGGQSLWRRWGQMIITFPPPKKYIYINNKN